MSKKIPLDGSWPDRSELPSPDEPDRAMYRATRCLPGEIAPNVLVPGDPVRAQKIATDYLEDAELVMVQREFHSYTGRYKGLPVSVISTGVGAPGAAMVMQDLAKLGCKHVIRVGTAGSCQTTVHPGDNVIATAAVRDEGLTQKFLPQNYPAAPDFLLNSHLFNAATGRTSQLHCGVVHSSDAFSSPALKADIELAQNAGVLAFEMEASAVLTLGLLLGLRVACVFSIDGFVANVAAGNTVPDKAARNRGIQTAIYSALDALVSINRS